MTSEEFLIDAQRRVRKIKRQQRLNGWVDSAITSLIQGVFLGIGFGLMAQLFHFVVLVAKP